MILRDMRRDPWLYVFFVLLALSFYLSGCGKRSTYTTCEEYGGTVVFAAGKAECMVRPVCVCTWRDDSPKAPR